MSRSMWSGNISFGMVTIPVKLHTATETYAIAFHQLHDKCDTRIQERRYCPHCDENVEWEDIVKGYEYSKNHYVELTKEDFEKLPLPSKHTIDVSDFVSLEEIDPIYFDSIYYIEVEKGSDKAFRLLLQGLSAKGLAGIATIAFRNKERLCALRPMKDTLVLQTLLYEDEIKKDENKPGKSLALSQQEKKMADTLIDALTTEFDPSKFKDSYQNALKKLIQAKLKGKEIKPAEIEPPTATTDLMEALKASLARTGKGSTRTGKGSARTGRGLKDKVGRRKSVTARSSERASSTSSKTKSTKAATAKPAKARGKKKAA